MRAMGIDFGLKRIGISLSDETKFLASPYTTLHRKTQSEDLTYLLSLIKNEKIDEIVCGLPMNMQGEEQDIAKSARDFMSELTKNLNISVNFVDERLSSVMVEDMLKEKIKDWRKRKEKLDAVAATIILQDYLDTK